jgi:hypothetical protein
MTSSGCNACGRYQALVERSMAGEDFAVPRLLGLEVAVPEAAFS